MASNTVTDDAETQQTEEAPFKQNVEKIEGRLVTLSQKINLCNSVLSDLKALNDVIGRKSLQDVSSTPQEQTGETSSNPNVIFN